MTDLSPAAAAVLDAYIAGLSSKRRDAISAALRAAADQCADGVTRRPAGCCGSMRRWGNSLGAVRYRRRAGGCDLTVINLQDHSLTNQRKQQKLWFPRT